TRAPLVGSEFVRNTLVATAGPVLVIDKTYVTVLLTANGSGKSRMLRIKSLLGFTENVSLMPRIPVTGSNARRTMPAVPPDTVTCPVQMPLTKFEITVGEIGTGVCPGRLRPDNVARP